MSTGSKTFPGRTFPDLHSAEGGPDWVNLFVPPAPPPLPDRLTPRTLRHAIASALERVSASELAGECVSFGLPAEAENEDSPWRGKWRYVERRIRHWKLPELFQLGRAVAAVYDDNRDLNHLLGLDVPGGVRGEMKNIIFAADGPKPKIKIKDALNNDLEITENADYCLVYDRPLDEGGLTWRQLVAWRAGSDSLTEDEERATGRELYRRLLKSAANGAERFIFERYCARYATCGFDIPALIPQVYLHYDPYTRRAGGTAGPQRMDFLLLLPRRRRVVLELDGTHHYARDDGGADPARYAVMAAADRELQLAGYEVYRFGGHELADRVGARGLLDSFFDRLPAGPA